MAAKGHPWLFVRFVVLSGRMVRRPLEYLQRPMCSGNSASYISVLYILVPPLSSHTTAEIFSQIAGIAPLHHIAVIQLVAGAAVVRKPSVDGIHSAGELPYIELVQIVNTLDIGTVIHRRKAGLHVYLICLADTLQYIVDTFAVAERYLRGRKDNAVRRYEKLLVLHTFVHIIQNGLARDGESTGVGRSGIHRRILRLYRRRFALRHRVGHVLILVFCILRLHRSSAAGGTEEQEYRQQQCRCASVLRTHVTAPS